MNNKEVIGENLQWNEIQVVWIIKKLKKNIQQKTTAW